MAEAPPLRDVIGKWLYEFDHRYDASRFWAEEHEPVRREYREAADAVLGVVAARDAERLAAILRIPVRSPVPGCTGNDADASRFRHADEFRDDVLAILRGTTDA